MSRISFQNYGIRAEQKLTHTEIAGRYLFQRQEEQNIFYDVVKKLELQPQDDFLEIGCGTGNLLIPLSFLVRSATGVDHPKVLSVLQTRFADECLLLIPGNFLDLDLTHSYSKILVYSVLHYLSNEAEVIRFIEQALGLLTAGGILLLGDIPNVDKKKRFLATKNGSEFFERWDEVRSRYCQQESPLNETFGLMEDGETVQFNDSLVLKILAHFRGKGFHSYVVPQPHNLPFCFTREDIVIRKLEG